MARAAIRFDLSSITAPIARAELHLYAFWKNGSNGFTIDLYAMAHAWNLAAADWMQGDTGVPWRTSGGDCGQKVASLVEPPGELPGPKWDIIDVTAAVRNGIAAPAAYHGWLLVNTAGRDGHAFKTSRCPQAGLRPKLLIQTA